ncbi:hypothetical protein FOL46_000174, partial [Perkinsus olseni]
EPLLPRIDREEVKLRSCITNLAVIAAPQIISMVLNYIPQTINVFFISRLGDADMLAAVGLANLVFNIGGVSFGYGINQAIETLVSQSRGHGGHQLASVHMAKGMCIGLLLSTILFIVLQFTEVALNFLGQDPVVAKHAMDYVNSASIGIWPAIQYDCIMRFLLCYHHPHICTWIYAITSGLHVLWCYLLVTPSSGLAGAGVAMALTFVGCWVLGILYFAFAMINPSITAIPRDALPRFTRAMFRGWWEYLKIGIPSMITLCSEWWAYEICTLIVGLLQDSAQLAAHVSVCNVSVLMFMMSYGLQTGLSAKIGAAVGSGNLHLARTYCKAAAIMGGGMLIVIEFILITFKMSIVNFYSAPEPEVMVSVYLATLLVPYLGIQEVFDFAQACMQGVFKGLELHQPLFFPSTGGASKPPQLTDCMKGLASIGGPQVISMVLNYIPQTINVYFISRLGDADMLAGIGLANLVFNIGGVSCGYGMNQAIETLVSQSRGQGDHKLASTSMARGMIIAMAMSTVLFGLLQLTEVLLTLLGQDPVIANHAMRYVNSASIGIWPAIQYDCIMRFLLCYHHPHVCTWIYAITSGLHVFWCYVLVNPVSGLAGAGSAMALTYTTCWVLGILYFVFAMINPSITAIPRDALPRFTRAMFRGWWEYLKIGIPSMITLCSEWWAYEIATLIVGLLHDSSQLAAHVSICNLFVVIFMLSYGLQTGLSAKVGSAVGAGELHLAKLYCKAGIVIGGSMIAIVILLLCIFRGSIVRLYAEKEPEVAVYELYLVRPLLCIILPFDFAQSCMQGVFKGLGIQRYAAPVNIFSYYILMLPLGYFLSVDVGLGVDGMWLGFAAGASVIAASYTAILACTNWSKHVADAQLRIGEGFR